MAKGNHNKLARRAVCHQRLKQAFAIVKSGGAYQAHCAQKAGPMT